MTNQEAIDKLEHLINSPVGREEIDETCFEVIKYLAAQEPRVMTLEELKSCVRETIWFQVKSNHTMKQLTRDGIAALIFIGLLHNWNGYGTVWRCWTSRPSKEEMEVTPWN